MQDNIKGVMPIMKEKMAGNKKAKPLMNKTQKFAMMFKQAKGGKG